MRDLRVDRGEKNPGRAISFRNAGSFLPGEFRRDVKERVIHAQINVPVAMGSLITTPLISTIVCVQLTV